MSSFEDRIQELREKISAVTREFDEKYAAALLKGFDEGDGSLEAEMIDASDEAERVVSRAETVLDELSSEIRWCFKTAEEHIQSIESLIKDIVVEDGE